METISFTTAKYWNKNRTFRPCQLYVGFWFCLIIMTLTLAALCTKSTLNWKVNSLMMVDLFYPTFLSITLENIWKINAFPPLLAISFSQIRWLYICVQICVDHVERSKCIELLHWLQILISQIRQIITVNMRFKHVCTMYVIAVEKQ